MPAACGAEAPSLAAEQLDIVGLIEQSAQVYPIDQLEAAAIKAAMRISKGNVKEAAVALGLSKVTLYRKVKETSFSPTAVQGG